MLEALTIGIFFGVLLVLLFKGIVNVLYVVMCLVFEIIGLVILGMRELYHVVIKR